MNKILLIGNVGKEPEAREFSGKQMLKFSVATRPNYKPQGGEVKPNWHQVIVWGNLAKTLLGKVHKGSRMFVEGELEQRSYNDKSGQKRVSYEVRADSAYVLETNASASAAGSPEQRDPGMDDDIPY